MKESQEGSKDKINTISLIQWAFLILIICGMTFPELFWGVNALAFIDEVWAVPFLLGAAVILHRGGRWVPRILSSIGRPSSRWLFWITIVYLFLFSFLDLPYFPYGDSRIFLKAIGESTTSLKPIHWSLFFSYDLWVPATGKNTLVAGVQILSYYSGLDHYAVFKILGVISGGAFIGFATWFSYKYFKSKVSQLIFLITSLTLPLLFNFFGHIEVYAPSFVLMLMHIGMSLLYMRDGKRVHLIIASLTLLFSIKFHFTAYFLLPAFILLILAKQKDNYLFLSWKKGVQWVLAPSISFGLLAYFFIFQDYNDTRAIADIESVYESLFLPIIPPPPPLDRYHLFHVNHLWDLFNMTLLLSMPTILILVATFFHQNSNFSSGKSVFLGISSILFVAFFFMIHPLLGIPLDWDLYSLAAIPLLFSAINAFDEADFNEVFARRLIPPVMCFGLFHMIFLGIHFNEDSLSQRHEVLGRRTFKTTWNGTATALKMALQPSLDKPKEFEARSEQMINDLEPFAIKGNDDVYSFILMDYAQYLRKEKNDWTKSLSYHERSREYFDDNPVNTLGLMENYFLLKDYKKAYLQAVKLKKVQYPDDQKSSRIAIHCALEAQLYDEAIHHISDHAQLYPKDSLIVDLNQQVEEGASLEALKFAFQRSRN